MPDENLGWLFTGGSCMDRRVGAFVLSTWRDGDAPGTYGWTIQKEVGPRRVVVELASSGRADLPRREDAQAAAEQALARLLADAVADLGLALQVPPAELTWTAEHFDLMRKIPAGGAADPAPLEGAAPPSAEVDDDGLLPWWGPDGSLGAVRRLVGNFALMAWPQVPGVFPWSVRSTTGPFAAVELAHGTASTLADAEQAAEETLAFLLAESTAALVRAHDERFRAFSRLKAGALLALARPVDESFAEYLSRLAESFPSLRGAPGVRPFDAMALKSWAGALRFASSARYAASFVLEVHRGRVGRPHPLDPFDVASAFLRWDDDHRAAFAAWAAAPRLRGDRSPP